MGSKPVREAHMRKYGAPLSEIDAANGVTKRPPTREEQKQSLDRLAEPRTKVEKFAYSTKASVNSRKQIEDLFPLHHDVPEVASVPKNAQYPEDWRRQPTPAPMEEPLTWVYGRITMTRLTANPQTILQAQQLVVKLLNEQGVQTSNDLTSRREVRAMLRSKKRFGVLIDIVATRRNILSGSPHDTALSIYNFVEEKYPVLVKFVFVGITDNGTKRVARDVFGPPTSKHKKLSFGAIDTEHLYVVHPKGDQGGEMRLRGDQAREEREAERKRRHCTPKFSPAPPPEWLAAVQERQSRSRTQTPMSMLQPGRGGNESSMSNNTNMNADGTGRNVVLDECNRCWLFGRARSASPSNPERSESRNTNRTNTPGLLDATNDEDITGENSVSQHRRKKVGIVGDVNSESGGDFKTDWTSIGGAAQTVNFTAKMAKRWRQRRSIAVTAGGGDNSDPLHHQEDAPTRPPSQMQQLKKVVQSISDKHANKAAKTRSLPTLTKK